MRSHRFRRPRVPSSLSTRMAAPTPVTPRAGLRRRQLARPSRVIRAIGADARGFPTPVSLESDLGANGGPLPRGIRGRWPGLRSFVLGEDDDRAVQARSPLRRTFFAVIRRSIGSAGRPRLVAQARRPTHGRVWQSMKSTSAPLGLASLSTDRCARRPFRSTCSQRQIAPRSSRCTIHRPVWRTDRRSLFLEVARDVALWGSLPSPIVFSAPIPPSLLGGNPCLRNDSRRYGVKRTDAVCRPTR